MYHKDFSAVPTLKIRQVHFAVTLWSLYQDSFRVAQACVASLACDGHRFPTLGATVSLRWRLQRASLHDLLHVTLLSNRRPAAVTQRPR